MDKMKIAIVGTAYPFRGGLASYNERLARAFQEAGHPCRIYTFTTQYPSFLFPGKTQYSESPAPSDIEITRALSSVNPATWVRLGQKLRKEAPDYLILKYWLPFMAPALGTVARIVKKNKHTKVICIIDNIIPHEARPGDNLLTQYFVKPIDAFVAMSRNVLDDLKKFDTQKPRTLNPHPVFDNFGEPVPKEVACHKLGLDPSGKYILFFGIIRDYKGLDILLEALNEEKVRQHGVKVIVAGEFYSNEEKYRKIIRDHGLEDLLVLATHFIKDEEVKYYFSAVDVVVQPYKHATQSGVTQIAYQFRKPMIVTKVGGLPELVPHEQAGLVIEVSSGAIAQGIDRFYSGDIHRFEAGIARKREEFGWDRMVDKIFNLGNTIQPKI